MHFLGKNKCLSCSVSDTKSFLDLCKVLRDELVELMLISQALIEKCFYDVLVFAV